jgi:2-dehydropantoate 2-reductase
VSGADHAEESAFSGSRPRTVGVLGVGGVGGMVAVRLAVAGQRVVCIGRRERVDGIRRDGLALEVRSGTLHALPEAVERLEEPVELLVVAVKEPALAEALERIEVFAVADGVVVPRLNGLEHPEVIRRRLGPRVAPGSIASFQAYATPTGQIVQETGVARVTAASDDLPRPLLERALQLLRVDGIEVVVADDERAVLWEKVARLAPLAAATVASGLTLGGLREDRGWRRRLEDAVAESCAAAAADGVAVSTESEWAMIEAMPPTLTTSAARDAAAGRPTELDAIAGSVLRVAHRLGLPCPVLSGLVEEAEARVT